MSRERRFATPDALAESLAADLAARLHADLAARGRASLIVSGGRTPTRLYERLSHAAVDWRRVGVGLADERLVAPDHRQSNARFVRDHLLQNRAAAAGFVALWPGTGDPAVGALAALQQLPRPFTAVVLGMGEDGHTASLFPHAPELAQALDPAGFDDVIEVPAADGRKRRLSLTLHALCDTAQVVLLFEGPAKRRAFEHALKPGPLEDFPVRAVLRQTRAPVDVYWSAGA
ncbi:MAG: 6-phosphogluconolactonase [Pseudomonadota bacterium]|nr:6-phosphogluconolactonase [Pseudomonadota bacterium]